MSETILAISHLILGLLSAGLEDMFQRRDGYLSDHPPTELP